jgi:phosphinothricin acetyltransferase
MTSYGILYYAARRRNASPANLVKESHHVRSGYVGAELEIREALPDDAHAIAALYVWHVLNGAPPLKIFPVDDAAPDQNRARQRAALAGGAVARIVGYCYATFYRPRPAYRYTLEESIYVESGMGGRGIGSALLSR